MEQEIVQNESVENVVADMPKITPFKKGDLIIECKCGAVETLETNVENGIAIQIPCTDYHKMTLHCKECGSHITIKFKESISEIVETVNTDNLIKEEIVLDEQIQEDSK